MGKRGNLIDFRKQLGLTSKDVAKKCKVSTTYYNMIENGKRAGSIGFWCKFQEVFGIENYDFWELIKN